MKKRILLVAFACKPFGGSESGVGWNYANLVRKACPNDDVYLLVWDNENQKELLLNSDGNFNYIFYELPKFITRFQIKQSSTGLKFMELYYLLWQIGAIIHLTKKFGRDYFDIVHHITFVSATLPSFFVFLKSKFIWGPLSSNDLVPKELNYSKIKYYKFWFRDLMKKIIRRFSIIFDIDKVKAQAIIVNTESIKENLKLDESKTYIISSIGIEDSIVSQPKNIQENEIVNICSIGEFLDIKNFDLTIEAFHKYQQINPNSQLYLIGDGDKKEYLQSLTKKLGIEDKVIFTGWVEREQVFEYLKNKMHILLFPTCEKAGMVILEALRCAVPVIGLNFGGPKEFADSSCGFLAKIKSREQMINDLAEGINKVVKNYESYSKAAFEKSKIYCWSNKLNQIKKIYDSLKGD